MIGAASRPFPVGIRWMQGRASTYSNGTARRLLAAAQSLGGEAGAGAVERLLLRKTLDVEFELTAIFNHLVH